MASPGARGGGPHSPKKGDKEPERRRNQPLRELLDELVVLVRTVSRNGQNMTPEDLEYAQERLQWLADEIWQSATQGGEPA
jgi:hypothetical protein